MARNLRLKSATINRASKFVDRSGMRYGRLTAAWPVGTVCKKRGKTIRRRRALWLCFCDCGGMKIIRSDNLKNGHVRSCGCSSAEWRGNAHRTHGMRGTPEYRMWCDAKKRAKRKGLSFTIRPQDIVIPDVCPLLGIPLLVSKQTPSRNSPTVDRKRNDLGYTPRNIQIISYKANSMKNDSTLEEFELLARNWRSTCESESSQT